MVDFLKVKEIFYENRLIFTDNNVGKRTYQILETSIIGSFTK